MPDAQELVKAEITDWLKATGNDRGWLASQLKVSKSTIDGWFSVRGIPDSSLQTIRLLMAREDTSALIGDAEGNLVSFTIAEFERIEQTRQRLNYDTRPPMYRDAILAYIEADESSQRKILPLSQSPLPQVAESPSIAAETTTTPPIETPRQPVTYAKPKRKTR